MKSSIKKYVKKNIKRNIKKCFNQYVKRYFYRFENEKKLLKLISFNNFICGDENFVFCSFKDLVEGDIVYSSTMTFSQKYILRNGYEDFNMEKVGILIKKNNDNPEFSVILKYDSENKNFVETNLYRDPGTSGTFSFKKYVDIKY